MIDSSSSSHSYQTEVLVSFLLMQLETELNSKQKPRQKPVMLPSLHSTLDTEPTGHQRHRANLRREDSVYGKWTRATTPHTPLARRTTTPH